MYGCFLNYYFFKNCIEDLPKEVRRNFEYEDSTLFLLSNFTNASRFSYVYNPFQKDRYQIHDKLLKENTPFIVECAIGLHQNNNFNGLLFLYAFIAATTLYDFLSSRIDRIKRETDNLEDIYNALDIYTSTKEKKDIIKRPLFFYFQDSYNYPEYIEKIIHNPMIRCYSFMGSRGYYTKSYKRFKHYCKYTCHGAWRKPFYKAYDVFFARHKQGKQHLPYELIKVKGDNQGYGIYHDALDAIWKDAKQEAINKINIINQYLFYKNEKEFRLKFDIPEAKKI